MKEGKAYQQKQDIQHILKENKYVAMYFYANWCAPCKILNPIFEEISIEYKEKIQFVKLDIDNSYKIAKHYKIHLIPTIILFKNGEEVQRIIDNTQKIVLIDKISKILY